LYITKKGAAPAQGPGLSKKSIKKGIPISISDVGLVSLGIEHPGMRPL